MMNLLPSLDFAYSLLLQDENQRESYVNATYTSDTASFMVTPQRRTSHKTSGPSLKGGFSPQQQQRYPNTSHRGGKMIHRNGPRRAKYNPNVSCTYCGKTGYVEDDCFRLHGFPDDFEFTKSKEFENSKGKSNQDLDTARSKGYQGKANGMFTGKDAEFSSSPHRETTNNFSGDYGQFLS
ncbi:hypothetical protein KY284_010072 [Solanum tuberosum]|nr:hypothetical protein KY284_010072 [Solanum tuberosum]